MGILIFTLTLAFIVWTSLIDSIHIEQRDHIDHFPRAMQRFTFFMLSFIIDWRYGIASGLLFAALFDQSLNYLIYKPIFFLGTTAKWDIFFSKRKWLYITVKIIALLGAITLFIIPSYG
jgi:hypothetical protein